MGFISLREDIEERHNEYWHKVKDQANYEHHLRYQTTSEQKIIYDQPPCHNNLQILNALARQRSQRFPRKLKDRIPTEQIMQIIKLRPRM